MLNELRRLTILLLCQSLIFAPLAIAGQLALPSGDLIAPQIFHEPITENVKSNSSQQIKANVTDNVGIKTVTLFYRTIGTTNYKRISMSQSKGTNEYSTTLGFEAMVEPGIEYYIQAVDLAGNALLHGYSFSPLKIGVLPTEATEKTHIAQTQPDSDDAPSDKKKINKWWWIGLGVLAAGAVAAAASSGGDDGGNPTAAPTVETGTVTVGAPVP